MTCNTDLMNVGQQIRRKAIASVAALSLVATCHALPVDAKDLSSRSRGGPGGTEGMAAVAELVSMEVSIIVFPEGDLCFNHVHHTTVSYRCMCIALNF